MAEATAIPPASPGGGSTSEDDLGTPLFLFCCFRTTGSSLLSDEVSEIAVKCWPYQEEIPSFHYQILTNKTNYIDSNCKRHGRFQHAMTELSGWIEETVKEASAKIGARLYPVLFSHGGDSKDFLFLFRSCGKNGIDLRMTCSLPVHFADPVPLLELLKVRRHPLLDESKYLTLGSLLNDWYPGMFDPEDLRSLPARAALTSQLYTQTTLYPVLSKVPIYNIDEWTQYYNAAMKYKEDKRELESHMPKHLKEVQARFAVRSILRAGYSWTTLLDLYRSCTSPLQFRQELRDIDLKSSIARDLAWMITDMKLEQTGSRPYVLKIKQNMSPQEYIGYASPRGYFLVLRVANKFPQCYLTLADLEFSLQQHPIEAPRGFSLTQRLAGPGSIPCPMSPGAWEFNNERLSDDGEDDCIWLEEGEDGEEDVESAGCLEDFLDSCCQLQREHQAHDEHRITSFVANGSFSRSLLLNCMEEEGEVESAPGLTEEEQRRREALWASVRANISSEPSNKTASHHHQGNSSKSRIATTNQGNLGRPAGVPQRYRSPRKGGGGRRRGHNELKKWNKRQRGAVEENRCSSNATKVQGLPKQTAVSLPRIGMVADNSRQVRPVATCTGSEYVNCMGEVAGEAFHQGDAVNQEKGCKTIAAGGRSIDPSVDNVAACNLMRTSSKPIQAKDKHHTDDSNCAVKDSNKSAGTASSQCHAVIEETSAVEGTISLTGTTIRDGREHIASSSARVYSIRPIEPSCNCHCHTCKKLDKDLRRGVGPCCGCHGNIRGRQHGEDDRSGEYENGVSQVKLPGRELEASSDSLLLIEHASGLGVDIVYPEHWKTLRNQMTLEEDLKSS